MQFIDLQKQQKEIRSDLLDSITKVLDRGSYILGPEVETLEQELASFTSSNYCLTTASGTDSLLMSLMALDIKAGDEVITTPFTWISTVEVIRLLGAEPVYCDIEASTFNLDPQKLEKLITNKTKAIIPVSLFGQCADYDRINDIAKVQNISVIEDGAQSFGATYKDKLSCSLTHIGCTSFFPSKPLGCYGDGGAIFTDDESVYEKLKAIRVHGASSKNNFDLVGINGRMDSIQAAILLVKLKIFKKEIQLRAEIAGRYNQLIKAMQHNVDEKLNIKTPYIDSHNTSVYAQYTIITDNRESILNRFKERQIPYAIHYEKLAFEHDAYKIDIVPDTPVAESLKSKVFSIPMHPYLAPEQQQQIVESIFY